MVAVTECIEVTDELVEAMDRLVPQLSDSSPPPTRAQLEQIVASPATALLVARDPTGIVGSLTLFNHIEAAVQPGRIRAMGPLRDRVYSSPSASWPKETRSPPSTSTPKSRNATAPPAMDTAQRREAHRSPNT